ALTLTGQADLDWISAQAQHNATLTGAEFSVLSAQAQADQALGRASIAQVEAGGRAAALEYSAQADDLQARLSELQAQSSLLQGERKEQGSRLQYAQAKSKATASMAARGLDLGQGSALAVRNSVDLMSERNAIAIQQDSLMAAFGHRMQSAQASLSAQSKRAGASAAVASAASQMSLTKAEAQYSTSMARINADATRALSAAGLVSTQAAGDYQRAMAGVMVNNASAAGMVRASMAPTYAGPSAGLAAFGSLLGGSGPLMRSWYAWSKEN
ncbi:MAG: hypothetical protein BGO13_13900, partial [Burkholderiales bacterium 66-5]